jgi:hypothetical protein
MPMPCLVEMSPDDLLDRIADDDRAWFAVHADRSHRWRMPIDGEAGTFGLKSCHSIVVRQIQPGLRMRAPVRIVGGPLELLDVEPIAHALFDLVCSGSAAAGGGVIPLHEFKKLALSYCQSGTA